MPDAREEAGRVVGWGQGGGWRVTAGSSLAHLIMCLICRFMVNTKSAMKYLPSCDRRACEEKAKEARESTRAGD